jgi:hypothetical protein
MDIKYSSFRQFPVAVYFNVYPILSTVAFGFMYALWFIHIYMERTDGFYHWTSTSAWGTAIMASETSFLLVF